MDDYNEYRVVTIRPNFPGDPDSYEPRFDTLNEAVTNAKEQQEYLQSEISVEDFDNADCESRFGCDELPYVLVEGSWDDDGYEEWDDLDMFPVVCPCEA